MHHGAASAWPWEGRARHRVLDGVGRYSGGIIVGEATVCRRCCIAPGQGRGRRDLHLGSDRPGQLVERDRQPPARRLLSGQLVMAPSKVLDEAMTANDHPGGTVLLEAAHRPQPRLQAAVVGLDPVVGVLLGSMPRCREQLLQHDRVGRCSVRDHLNGQHLGRADGPLKEPTGCLGVAL
jgi:hypothetical protein